MVELSGAWDIRALESRARVLKAQLRLAAGSGGNWDLSHVQRLDHIGALLIWQAWGKRRLYRRVPWKMIDASYEPIREALDRTTARLGLRSAPLAKKNRIVDLTKQQGAAS